MARRICSSTKRLTVPLLSRLSGVWRKAGVKAWFVKTARPSALVMTMASSVSLAAASLGPVFAEGFRFLQRITRYGLTNGGPLADAAAHGIGAAPLDDLGASLAGPPHSWVRPRFWHSWAGM